ncbi:MAG: FkbM family methyltransferase [Bacteroidota bacterium]
MQDISISFRHQVYKWLHKYRLSHSVSRTYLTTEFPPFRWLYRLFKRVNLTKTVYRNDTTYKVLLSDGAGVMNFVSDYEPWLDQLLPILLQRKAPVFVDIGANIGQTMLKVLPQLPGVQYFAVEPNPACVSYLKKLCALNKFTDVRIQQTALSNRQGDARLMLRFSDDLLATTTAGFRKFTRYSEQILVPITTADLLFGQLLPEKIDVIKIDVEGGEADVIEGMLATIEKHKPVILCEILPVSSTDNEVTIFRRQNANRLVTAVSSVNYQIINIATKEVISTIDDLSDSLESSNYMMLSQGRVINW